GDTDLARAAQRLVQNRVSFFPTLLRFEEIWPVEKLRIDLFQIYEVGDIDRMRGLDPHLLEVLVLQNNVTAALIFKTLHDLVGRNLFRVGFCDLLVSDRAEIARPKLPET